MRAQAIIGMAGHDAMAGQGTGMGASGTTAAATGSTTGSAGAGAAGTTATDAMAGGPRMAEDADLHVIREKHEAERQRLSQLQGVEVRDRLARGNGEGP